jgi:hypothetical protein
MTIDQFLNAFETIAGQNSMPGTWMFIDDSIRFVPSRNRWFQCPISFMADQEQDAYKEVAVSLGLSEPDTNAIICAADCLLSLLKDARHVGIRQRLLAATGLEEPHE